MFQLLERDDYQLAFTVVMKNCDPLESGPEFAIDKIPVGQKKGKILISRGKVFDISGLLQNHQTTIYILRYNF